MAPATSFDYSRLSLSDLLVTGKGAKQIPLRQSSPDGKEMPLIWQPETPLTPVFEPSAYNDPQATRLNMSLSVPPEAAETLRAFDEWAVNTLALESSRLLGGQLSADEVRRRYQPALRTHEATGSHSVRVKFNTSGKQALKVWDNDRTQREMPEAWLNCTVTPRIRFKGFWIMAKELGPLLDLEHCMIDEAKTECPF